MARLSVLRGRSDEAWTWFEAARAVLDEQGARPLRADTDLDKASARVRLDTSPDRARARTLLGAAVVQFEDMRLLGWSRAAEALARTASLSL